MGLSRCRVLQGLVLVLSVAAALLSVAPPPSVEAQEPVERRGALLRSETWRIPADPVHPPRGWRPPPECVDIARRLPDPSSDPQCFLPDREAPNLVMPDRYAKLLDNFVEGGVGSAWTTYEIEETTRTIQQSHSYVEYTDVRNSARDLVRRNFRVHTVPVTDLVPRVDFNGVQLIDVDDNPIYDERRATYEQPASYKLSVWCAFGYRCTWTGNDIPATNDTMGTVGDDDSDAEFTAREIRQTLPEEEPYVAPSQTDIDRAPLDRGRVGSNPRSNTPQASYDAVPHCGELFTYEDFNTEKLGDLGGNYANHNHIENRNIAQRVHEWDYYIVDDKDDPTRCVLADPLSPYETLTTHRMVRSPHPRYIWDTDPNESRLAGEVLRDSRPLQWACQSANSVRRGQRCSQTPRIGTGAGGGQNLVEYKYDGNIKSLPSITSPKHSDAPDWDQDYAETLERERRRCNGITDCERAAEIRAQNRFNREAERYDARWQRFQQQVAAMEANSGTQPFWVCTPKDEWAQQIQNQNNAQGSLYHRCYLIG
ncbi:MAG: hypothetical protein OXE79_00135 [Acidimicrobiaceae bacterium]|nr:hypothetical protein [Acidimicrobiaceae bacterium]